MVTKATYETGAFVYLLFELDGLVGVERLPSAVFCALQQRDSIRPLLADDTRLGCVVTPARVCTQLVHHENKGLSTIAK